jgi:hypothetical protein
MEHGAFGEVALPADSVRADGFRELQTSGTLSCFRALQIARSLALSRLTRRLPASLSQ